MSKNNIIYYWTTGDYKYATQLMGDLVLNVLTLGLGKLIEKIAPSVVSLFKNIFNKMDETAKLSHATRKTK